MEVGREPGSGGGGRSVSSLPCGATRNVLSDNLPNETVPLVVIRKTITY